MWSSMRHSIATPEGQLPACLCKLLRLAVADARKAASTPGYKLDMAFWHTPNGSCRVCMAGAVIAMTLGGDRREILDPRVFVEKRPLLAINEMRIGMFITAHRTLYQFDAPDSLRYALESAHDIVRNGYRSSMLRAPWFVYEQAARVLEVAGL